MTRANVYAVVAFLSSSRALGPAFCGTCFNGGAPPMDANELSIKCLDAGATVAAVTFASYGTATGACPAFVRGACDAANSSAIVSAACLGAASCTIWPNTTTFGDPCYGSAKSLDVVLACSSGAGSATCSAGPPPTPLANFSASVAVDFSRVTATVRAVPSLQVVSQARLWRGSAAHDGAFATLAAIAPRRARFVPWIPYAAYGVGELMPPSGAALCAPQSWVGGQTAPVTLDCGVGGGTIASIDFASFGRPTGNCGAYAAAPTCDAPGARGVVEALCVGKAVCSIPTAPGGAFGTPCGGATWLAPPAEGAYAPDQGGIVYRASDLAGGAALAAHATHPVPAAVTVRGGAGRKRGEASRSTATRRARRLTCVSFVCSVLVVGWADVLLEVVRAEFAGGCG
jgi:hypothetical protein